MSWAGHPVTVAVFSVLAVAELVTDKHPSTPSRTTAVSFAGRIIAGVRGRSDWHRVGLPVERVGAGVLGAVCGTMGGYHVRARLVAARDGQDLPIALLEDAIAVLGGFAVAAMTAVV